MNQDPRFQGKHYPVNKIIPFSSVDGPGNRTAVFVQGCNFNCRYCHNPETRELCINCGECDKACPAGALGMQDGLVSFDPAKCVSCDTCIHICKHNASPRIRWMTAEDVHREILKNVPFIRGVSVSGGECTFYPELLHDLAVLCKRDGLGFLLDSNGMYDFSEDPAGLLPVIDGVMLDVKAWSAEDHQRVTGCDNALVRKNIRTLGERGKLFEVRTVVVPELFHVEETIVETARAIRPYLAIARAQKHSEVQDIRYKIIKYRPMGVRKEYQEMCPPEDAYLKQLAEIARKEGIRDTIII
ncbi:MAG: YjjW family glycine radical enzyme activase [Oribacterium sp.]|nr:YjjW family glycine radical enzyme activase [Oribacterium sp.]